MTVFTSPLGGPSMRPRPGTVVVSLFDGQCGVCTRSAGWIGRRDPNGRIERLDLRDPDAAARFPDLSADAVRAHMHAIDATGRIHVGIDGVIAVLRELPRWHLVATGLGLPGIHALAALGYGWFARNRLWFNRFLPIPPGEAPCTDACAVDWDALAAEANRPAGAPGSH